MIVDVYSDFACPWCYVGLRRFRRALEGLPGADLVRTVHRPFQLDATLCGPAVPLAAVLVELFGRDGAEQNTRAVYAAGAEVGIGFRFDRALAVNSFAAHRLAWLADRECDAPVRDEVVERLFAAYFVEGKDVSDHGQLTELAVRSGMDGRRVSAYLASGEGVQDVREAVARACRVGIVELPTYVFPGGHRLAASVSVSDYRQALEPLAAAAAGHR
jgi:predicted DsbA family dithiol-disulfide isomerase